MYVDKRKIFPRDENMFLTFLGSFGEISSGYLRYR